MMGIFGIIVILIVCVIIGVRECFPKIEKEEIMSPRRILNTDQLYTSAQVRKILSISPSTLTTLVEKGFIEKVTPVGYKNGFYTKVSVDEYYRQQNLFMQTYSLKRENKLEIRKAVGEDQPGIYEMEKEVLGATLPLEKRVELYKKNPDIDFVAVKDSRVIGHLSLFPLHEQVIRLLLEGKLRGWDITADDLEAYKAGNQYKLFVMAIAVDKNEQQAGKIYAGLLLREAQKTVFEMAWQKILVRAIYATSRTKDGIFLASRMGMDTIPELSDVHRKAFVLDIGTGETHWAREYRDYLRTLELPPSLTEGILSDKSETISKP
jgi:hypothetical protein